MLHGIVTKALNSYYYVRGDIFETRCKLRGRFKKERFSLVVGDQVEYVLLDDGSGIIEAIAPRHSVLLRPFVANVDQVILTFAAAAPDLHPLLLDRFLVLAETSQLEIVICVNKADLADFSKLNVQLEVYGKIGYRLIYVSAAQELGIDILRDLLKNKVSVFAGPSGVGKSTLLNALEPGLKLATGTISQKIRRGKHTTRVAELLPLAAGGFVVDTPGFSFTEFDQIEKTGLAHCFPEFRPLVGLCKFNTCLHSHEPRCAVKDAVADGRVTSERYQAYLNILNEIQSIKKEF